MIRYKKRKEKEVENGPIKEKKWEGSTKWSDIRKENRRK